jgi:putative Holliday junction resolvase
MARILGIDFGEKRIGLALSDEGQQFAFEMDIWSPEEFFENIKALLAEKDIEKVVLGLPLNMSGGHTAKTKEAIEFKEKLEKEINVPVEMIDERLTSQMAANIAGTSKNIDSLAAQIFLQNYLNKNKPHVPEAAS